VSIPVAVAGGATNWAALTAGDGHTCARRTSGRLFCWGRDGQGQLGDGGTDSPRSTPTEVAA
jgi:alpha-tubulin suppressor-like RCC1 family protein